MERIKYVVGENDHTESLRGRTLTGGIPTEIQGIQVVRFAEKIGGKTICMKYDNRPELAALVAEYKDCLKKEREEIEKNWAEKKAKQDAIDAVEIEKMEKDMIELRKKIPAGAIEVSAKEIGRSDGIPIMEYTANGVEISWRDIVSIGWASAIRPGALGAFREKCIAYIMPEKLEEIVSGIEEKKTQAEGKARQEQEKIESLAKEAKETNTKKLLRSWMTSDCMNKSNECSFDRAAEYILPDGKRKIEYTCCY